MTENQNIIEGWYEINEEWPLFIDGVLRRVTVHVIHVEKVGGVYDVSHYDEGGSRLTTVCLTEDDVRQETDRRETLEPAWR